MTSDPRTLPPMQVFRDVLAGPSPNRQTPGVLWPDFDMQENARLWRKSKPRCPCPEIDGRNARIIEEPGVFVSMHDLHFGHIVSETVSRIPQSLAQAPGLPLYFSAKPDMDAAQPSAVFRAIMEWLNVPMDRVRFIREPTLFRELHVAVQAEHLDGPAPPDEYLDLLEARIKGNLEPTRPEGIVFVSRAQLGPESEQTAAERYLAFCLERLGVRVVHPETLTLPQQMRVYAGAKHLVFSEGSAIHGRQLLGRIDQHISVLRRRFRSHIAQHQIEPRCTSLTYVPCFKGALSFPWPEGFPRNISTCSEYRLGPVFEHFESLGIPLRQVWKQRVYERTRDDDILAWIRALYNPRVAHWVKHRHPPEFLLAQFEQQGLGHLRDQAASLIGAVQKIPGLGVPAVKTGAPSPPRENAADILCIGAPRAMTTWLHRTLAAHPDASAMPDLGPIPHDTKGARFWTDNHHRGAEWYRVVTRPRDDRRMSLDVSPGYALMDETAIAECKALNPTARVIYILRDPLARAISAIRAQVTGAATPAQNPIIHHDAGFLALCDRLQLRAHSDYTAHVARWRKAYPGLIILDSRDIAANPIASARRIASVCGLMAGRMNQAEAARFETCARRVVSASSHIPLDPDCVHFLQGMLWQTREAARRDLGLSLAEGDAILAAC
ncbi:MAG: DUF563 domain-containing protein [Rhodobacteraceae bacterium]|nr:DUF563 domain-containing protein [Paracoccaceae bacterium]